MNAKLQLIAGVGGWTYSKFDLEERYLWPDTENPLNLSRSLSLASNTSPGSLSLPVTLCLLRMFLESSKLIASPEEDWMPTWHGWIGSWSCTCQYKTFIKTMVSNFQNVTIKLNHSSPSRSNSSYENKDELWKSGQIYNNWILKPLPALHCFK